MYENYQKSNDICGKTEAFKIPWIIFSDAENTPETNIKSNVQQQFLKCGSTKNECDCIIFVDDGNDFEKQLIEDGFCDEIRKAIASFEVYENEHHRAAREPILLAEIGGYTEDELYNIITGKKTKYSPAIAEQIIISGKDLPPKVVDIFNKIAVILKIEEVDHDEPN